MEFQITTDGKITKYNYFKDAAKDLDITSKTIHRFLNNSVGGGKFQRRSDKKVFFIERTTQLLETIITIDGEDFYSIPQILKTFGLRQKNFLSQMAKNHFGFIDSKGNLHKINWVHEILLDVFKKSKLRRINEDLIKLNIKVRNEVKDYRG